MEDNKVVAIRTFNSVNEAQLYKALLESAGIQARMKNDIAAQVMPVYGAMLDIDLLVAEEDVARAEEILEAKFDEQEFLDSTGPKKRVRKCVVKK